MSNLIVAPEVQPFFELAQEINRRCLSEQVDTQTLAQFIITAAGRLGGRIPDEAIMGWLDSFDYFNNLMEARRAEALLPEDERTRLLWAWPSWNELLDPAEGGMITVLAAGDGAGKTSAAEQQAESWAAQGFKVVFVHYELSKAVMTDRRASRNATIVRRSLQQGILSEGQEQRLVDAENRLRAFPGEILYIHSPGWTPERTTQVLHSLHVEGQCDVVIIDYLEKVAASDSQLRRFGNNHFTREADTVEQFKNFAEAHNIHALILAQFSKAGKDIDFDKLTRTSIRGAGEKTEKANIVMLLHRDRDEDGDYGAHIKCKVDKNTLGPTGSFEQRFNGRYFRIEELDVQQPLAP